MDTKRRLLQVVDKYITVGYLSTCLILGYYDRTTLATAECLDLNYKGTSYKFCSSAKPREEAQLECHNYSMQLAVISTSDEFFHWKTYFAANARTNQIWVGATFSSQLKAFVWDTGGEVPADFFGLSGPNVASVTNGTCLRISTNQWLAQLACNERRGSLCQEVTKTTTVATTDVPVLTDLSTTQEEEQEEEEEEGVITENVDTPTISMVKSTTDDATTPVDTGTFHTTDLSTEQTLTENADTTTIFMLKSTTDDETTLVDTGTFHTTDLSTTQTITENVDTTNIFMWKSTTDDVTKNVDTTNIFMWKSTTDDVTIPDDTVTFQTTVYNVTSNGSLCACDQIPSNYTKWLTTLKHIQEELHINYKTLSATIRRKTSTADNRPSCKGIGYSGVIIMLALVLTIVAVDISTFVLRRDTSYRSRHIKTMR